MKDYEVLQELYSRLAETTDVIQHLDAEDATVREITVTLTYGRDNTGTRKQDFTFGLSDEHIIGTSMKGLAVQLKRKVAELQSNVMQQKE